MARFALPAAPSVDENIKYDSDGYPIAFDSSSSEGSECIEVAAPNTMKSASSPTTSFAKVRVPTRQDRADKGLLTSTLTATISRFRTRNVVSGGVASSRRSISPSSKGVVFTSVDTPETPVIEKRNKPWVCDNCGTANQPFDFLCWFCKTHTRCAKCVVPDEVDHDFDLPPVESRFNKLTLLNMSLTEPSDFTSRVTNSSSGIGEKVKSGGGRRRVLFPSWGRAMGGP